MRTFLKTNNICNLLRIRCNSHGNDIEYDSVTLIILLEIFNENRDCLIFMHNVTEVLIRYVHSHIFHHHLATPSIYSCIKTLSILLLSLNKEIKVQTCVFVLMYL